MGIIQGYERITEWKHYTVTSVAQVCKDGKTFLICKYRNPVMPPNNGSLSEQTYNAQVQTFEMFVHARTSFNQTLRKAAKHGELVVPVEEFVEDNCYMEVREIIEGVIPFEDMKRVLEDLTFNEKKLLMISMARALSCLHVGMLVHGNLTPESFLFMRNESGQYKTKLAHFEDCYRIGNPPECFLGDIRYYAPEVMVYDNEEDDKESLKSTLTRKADIFSLGLVYHYLLTGEFPEVVGLNERLQKRKDEGKPVYCWSALLGGGKLRVSDAIPGRYKLIIEGMLDKNPNQRPDALGVMSLLQLDDMVKKKP